MKHVFKLLAVILPVFFIGYILEYSRQVSFILGDYFEVTTQLLPLVISFSIFGITWYAYGRSRDNHSLFLGAAFFIIGLLDLYHMSSYPFMPDFITPNTLQKSAIFLGESMLFSALLFLASAYVYKNTLPWLVNKAVLFVSAIVLSFISLITVLFYPEYLPVMYLADGNPSYRIIFVQLITAALMLYAGYLYTRRSQQETEQNTTIFLIYSFIIFASGTLAEISYSYAGHLLKAAGLYFVYLALYKTSVEEPFEKLTEAETMLRLVSEERYRNLFESANDAILTTALDGTVTSWNRSAEKIFGWGTDEVIGQKLSQLVVPPAMQAESEKIIHDVLMGDAVSGIETVYKRKEGSEIYASLTVSPLIDVDRDIIGMSYIIRDITERKQAETIRLENIRLEYANRTKSEFLANMSHELRAPLHAIIGFSEVMKHGEAGKLDEKQEHLMDNILTSSQYLLNLINDILDLSKIEAGKIDITIEKFSVPLCIAETLILIKEKATKHKIIIKKEFDPLLDFVEADKLRFKQILFNLLSNAVKFSKEEGGVVTVKTKKVEDMAQISVSDTGIGIREENMGRLFNKFEQLDSEIARKRGGTGLGLAISKQLVELHGGKIWAESRFGEGSTFTFMLPLAAKNEENA